MHISSYLKMEQFSDIFLDKYRNKKISILDVGSQNVNGSYRNIFNKPNWTYTGCDMAAGDNVDIVLSNIYNWKEIKTNTYDVVISGQCFEHIEYFWVTMLEISRVLKQGGLCCIIAPSSGYEHKYPVDCWRFYPDGFAALAKFAELELIEVYTEWDNIDYKDKSGIWHDSVLICRKPVMSVRDKFKFYIKNILFKLMVS